MTGAADGPESELLEAVRRAGRGLRQGGLENDTERVVDAIITLLPAFGAGAEALDALTLELARAKRALEATKSEPEAAALRFIQAALEVTDQANLRDAVDRDRQLRWDARDRADGEILDALRQAGTPLRASAIAIATDMDASDVLMALRRLRTRRLALRTAPATQHMSSEWRYIHEWDGLLRDADHDDSCDGPVEPDARRS